MSERCRTDEHPAEATHSKAEAANSVRRDPEKKRRYTEVLLTGSEDPAPEISFLVHLLKVVQLQVRNTRFILYLNFIHTCIRTVAVSSTESTNNGV